MSDVPKSVIACHFAPKYLIGILSELLEESPSDDFVLWRPDECTRLEEIEEVVRGGRVILLLLCENGRDLRQLGVKCPYEFVVGRNDLVRMGAEAFVKQLRIRVAVIEAIGGRPNFAQLQDWFAGTFRRYLYLNARAHGNDGCLELEKDTLASVTLSADGNEKIRQDLKKRFGDKWTVDSQDANEMLRLRSLLSVLFNREIVDGSGICWFGSKLSDDKTFKRWADGIYGGTKHEDIPQVKGDRIRYVTPTGRINVLRIDDDAKSTGSGDPFGGLALGRSEEADPDVVKAKKETLQKQLEDLIAEKDVCVDDVRYAELRGRCKKIKDDIGQLTCCEEKLRTESVVGANAGAPFYVHEMIVKASDFGRRGLVQTVERDLKHVQEQGLSYDLVVLDLNLGDCQGSDLSGYHLIKVLKMCLPNVPIVIYSKSEDIGHIMRAFQCGASWYLKKSEPEKIKRHVMELFKRSVWREDWQAMKECASIQFVYDCKSQEFEDKFNRYEGWKYLTAKCLEYYPGKFITVSEMGGGLSTSVTFKARKGLRLDGRELQSPVIVKIGTSYNTRMEYERYFRWIRPYMSNSAGRIEAPSVILDRNTSAIVYTFAGRNDGSHRLVSLKEMIERDILFRSSCNFAKYERVFDMLFDDILPKIHRVTPDREFGSGEKNRHVEVFSCLEALDAKPSEEAFFPNAAFGEVEREDFWRSYVRRFPVSKRYRLKDNAKFVDQPYCDFEQAQDGTLKPVEKEGVVRFVYHERSGDEDATEHKIVVYDENDRQVVFSGSTIDHIARFRHRVQPGASLWLKKGSYEEDKEPVAADVDELSGCTKRQEYEGLMDGLVDLSQQLFSRVDGRIGEERRALLASKTGLFKSPLAICHGDLNFGNIMVEQSATGVADPWLIDFARTRRDLIAHDFNVLFTTTFALLFNSNLFEAEKGDEANGYKDVLNRILPCFIKDVIFAENDNPPDYIASDARLTFVYRLLMRIRRAAEKAGVSRHMYVLTTALESLLAVRFQLKHGTNRAADAFIDVSDACYKWLKVELELDLVKGYGQEKGWMV